MSFLGTTVVVLFSFLSLDSVMKMIFWQLIAYLRYLLLCGANQYQVLSERASGHHLLEK